jgi:hypothetical protein
MVKSSGLKMKSFIVVSLLLIAIFLSSCISQLNLELATPMSEELLSTSIVLTLEAGRANLENSFQSTPITLITPLTIADIETNSVPPVAFNSSPTPTVTQTPTSPSAATQSPTPLSTAEILASHKNNITTVLPPLPTQTPSPEIPVAPIQILNIGDLSKVVSPIQVLTRLNSHTGKVLRIELQGEDGRFLARYLEVFDTIPWPSVEFSKDIVFETNRLQESSRLIISVEDISGRLMDLNSVNLTLLSSGKAILNPPNSQLQAIVIQEPIPNSRTQGGMLLVSGFAHPDPNHPIKMELIDEDGVVLGHRLARVSDSGNSEYGLFEVEVPYSIKEPTSARLLVYQDSSNDSDIIHLSSVEILLNP